MTEELSPLLAPASVAPVRAARREKATAAMAATVFTWEQAVQICCIVDQMYFELYYAWMSVMQGYQQHPVSGQQANATRPHDQPFAHIWYVWSLIDSLPTLSLTVLGWIGRQWNIFNG